MTGNEDVVEAVAKKTGRSDVMTKSVHSILSASEKRAADGKILQGKTVKAVAFSKDSFNDVDSDDDSASESSASDVESGSSVDSSSWFVKVSRTPEQLEAEKEAKRAERKANKKAVKEARNEKRQTKIKKKDKKRAIKKSKAGNKK